jgi:hypothetical protein
MSLKSMKDIASIAYTPLQQLHIIYTSDMETRRFLKEVRFRYKCYNKVLEMDPSKLKLI